MRCNPDFSLLCRPLRSYPDIPLWGCRPSFRWVYPGIALWYSCARISLSPVVFRISRLAFSYIRLSSFLVVLKLTFVSILSVTVFKTSVAMIPPVVITPVVTNYVHIYRESQAGCIVITMMYIDKYIQMVKIMMNRKNRSQSVLSRIISPVIPRYIHYLRSVPE